MGKVGSATIKNSLENLRMPNAIHHVHFLSWEGLKEAEDYCANRTNGKVPEHIINGKRLRYQIDRIDGGNPFRAAKLLGELRKHSCGVRCRGHSGDRLGSSRHPRRGRIVERGWRRAFGGGAIGR